MSRHLVKVSMALSVLLGLAQVARAQTLTVTALPLPHAACPGVSNAVPNDGINDWPAFDCAVKLVPTGGSGTIYVPAGTFDLAATVSIVDRNVAVRGEGQQVTRLVWNHSGDGLAFQSTSSGSNVNYTLAVRSLSLIKAATDGGAAIHGIWMRPVWHGEHGVVTTTINDVHIGTDPWPSGSAYWHFGIQLQNSTTAKISMFNIQGSSASGGIAAIQIHGDNPTDGKSIGTQIRNGTIIKYVRGIEAKEWAEGLHVQEVAIRECGWGIQMSGAAVASQGTSIANNYISARFAGIELNNAHRMGITNNTIDQFEDANFMGIVLVNATANRIMGNCVYSTGGSQPRNGIVLIGNMANNVVEGNVTMNMNTGVWIHGGVLWTSVVGNINRNATNAVLDWGAATYIAHNH